jgi:hypothetical protein
MTEETSFVFEATGRYGTGREFETPFRRASPPSAYRRPRPPSTSESRRLVRAWRRN